MFLKSSYAVERHMQYLCLKGYNEICFLRKSSVPMCWQSFLYKITEHSVHYSLFYIFIYLKFSKKTSKILKENSK